ncbi:hypothetical protein F5878DRAFT_644317 [Lentinula raphanica]|uniref:Uncharacterized protein n=1 Tax=Lentinula raphanica TaxID=153919 RepID=A0AA38P371_9AGAR|nr:hypothetical protein F5878DRAFT_644317 [Lentinula raphanica]
MSRRSRRVLRVLYASRRSRPTSIADGPGFIYAYVDHGHLWKAVSMFYSKMDAADSSSEEKKICPGAQIDLDFVVLTSCKGVRPLSVFYDLLRSRYLLNPESYRRLWYLGSSNPSSMLVVKRLSDVICLLALM